MEIILHFPTETPSTRTRRAVESFELEFGHTNRVHIEYTHGASETLSGRGLTVSGATE